METSNKKDSSAQRMEKTLDYLRISANKLASELGYKSHSSIYHVLKGVNDISIDMAHKITAKYPKISFLYLTGGEGDLIVKDSTNQNNIFGKLQDSFSLDDLIQIPQLLKEQNELLGKILKKLDSKEAS